MIKSNNTYLILSLLFFSKFSMGQMLDQYLQDSDRVLQAKAFETYSGPTSITRNIKLDNQGRLWIASWEGIFRLDGKDFNNITKDVSLSRFFAIMQDSKGHFWFGSIGEGVYYYDGKIFKNYTSNDGLASNRVMDIYEDQKGNVWFSTEGGVSVFNGETFTSYTTEDGLADNDSNGVVEDDEGNYWIASRGQMSLFNGKTFQVVKNGDQSFSNVRTIKKDNKGDIWFGGNDGLWKYDGQSYKQMSADFVGYIYQDSKGNNWTSSQRSDHPGWSLTKYTPNAMISDSYSASVIWSMEGMLFGISEDSQGHIWFGKLDGVCRYDGQSVICPTDPGE